LLLLRAEEEAFLLLLLAKPGMEKGKAINTKRIIANRKTLGDPNLEVIGRNLS
jgi:hypothetical protein